MLAKECPEIESNCGHKERSLWKPWFRSQDGNNSEYNILPDIQLFPTSRLPVETHSFRNWKAINGSQKSCFRMKELQDSDIQLHALEAF